MISHMMINFIQRAKHKCRGEKCPVLEIKLEPSFYDEFIEEMKTIGVSYRVVNPYYANDYSELTFLGVKITRGGLDESY